MSIVEKIEPGLTDTVFVYTTVPTQDEARSIAMSSIHKKLAICADFWIINSIYPWHGVIQEVDQYMLMLTTEKVRSDDLLKWIAAAHSYSTPMIARLDTAVTNPDYKFWVDMTLKDPTEYLSESEAEAKREFDAEGSYHFGKLK
jgi:periplasmic divalent cation tolerance protein